MYINVTTFNAFPVAIYINMKVTNVLSLVRSLHSRGHVCLQYRR